MAWEPDRRSNFFFGPPAHLCAVTYMTEISLIVTLNNQFNNKYPADIHNVSLGTFVQCSWQCSSPFGILQLGHVIDRKLIEIGSLFNYNTQPFLKKIFRIWKGRQKMCFLPVTKIFNRLTYWGQFGKRCLLVCLCGGKPKQNPESTEGCSKCKVRKNNDKFGKMIGRNR